MNITDLITFSNAEFEQLRTAQIDDNEWFVGKDVADALGYSSSSDAIIGYVDDDDKIVASCTTPGGVQDMVLINESGLYSLIFGSKKDEAKKFKRWVTNEVLPALRKTGAHSTNTPEPLDETTSGFLSIISDYSTQLKDLKKRICELEERNKILEHDAALYQEYVCSNLLLSIRETAKQIGIDEKGFKKWLTNKHYIVLPKDDRKDITATTTATKNGWLRNMPYKNSGNGYVGITAKVTPKGLVFFAESLVEEHRI